MKFTYKSKEIEQIEDLEGYHYLCDGKKFNTQLDLEVYIDPINAYSALIRSYMNIKEVSEEEATKKVLKKYLT